MAKVRSKKIYLTYKLGEGEVPEWIKTMQEDDMVRILYGEDEKTPIFAEIDLLSGTAYCGWLRGGLFLEGWKKWEVGQWLLYCEEDGETIICDDDELEELYEVIKDE